MRLNRKMTPVVAAASIFLLSGTPGDDVFSKGDETSFVHVVPGVPQGDVVPVDFPGNEYDGEGHTETDPNGDSTSLEIQEELVDQGSILKRSTLSQHELYQCLTAELEGDTGTSAEYDLYGHFELVVFVKGEE